MDVRDGTPRIFTEFAGDRQPSRGPAFGRVSTRDPLYDADVNVKGLLNVSTTASKRA